MSERVAAASAGIKAFNGDIAQFLRQAGFPIALFVFALIFPIVTDSLYYMQLITEIIIMALLAMSLNILIGHSGLVSLGHAAFFGLGAYVGTIVMRDVFPSIWLGLFAAGAAAAFVALVIGVFCIRLEGLYFAMITLAFSQVLYTVAFYWTDMTGGDDGMINIPRPDIGFLDFHYSLQGFVEFYYFALVVVAVLLLVIWRILYSPFGSVLRAIRENPERVEFLGLPVQHYKLIAFVLSGTFGGLAGGLFAPFQGFISPDLLYWTKSGEIVLMTILGGVHTFLGPAIGAAILIFVRDTVLNYTEYWKIVVGSILIACVLFLPGGVLGFLDEKGRRIFTKKKVNG